jgi:hypothetical protein
VLGDPAEEQKDGTLAEYAKEGSRSGRRSLGSRNIAAERAAFEHTVQQITPEHLVFLDESGGTTSLVRTHARASNRERTVRCVPFGRYERLTLHGGADPTRRQRSVVDPAVVSRSAFAAFAEQVLIPTWGAEQVGALDNLAAQKSAEVGQVVCRAGCRCSFFRDTPRSTTRSSRTGPKVKKELRYRAARTLEKRDDAAAVPVHHNTRSDARGSMRHGAYKLAPNPT